MSIDVKAKIEGLASKIQKDPALLGNFQKDPVKTLEDLTGLDLPEEQLKPLVTGIKAKLAASDLGDRLGGLKKALLSPAKTAESAPGFPGALRCFFRQATAS